MPYYPRYIIHIIKDSNKNIREYKFPLPVIILSFICKQLAYSQRSLQIFPSITTAYYGESKAILFLPGQAYRLSYRLQVIEQV